MPPAHHSDVSPLAASAARGFVVRAAGALFGRDARRVAALVCALAAPGCDDVSTFKGSFSGSIIDGSFVRRCFQESAELELEFDPDLAIAASAAQAAPGEGNFMTSQGLFDRTALEPLSPLPNDQLSLFDFPGPRRRNNFLLFARASEGPMAGQDATVVVSLLDDESIELRVLGRTGENTSPCPDSGSDEPLAEPAKRELFGVFRLGKR